MLPGFHQSPPRPGSGGSSGDRLRSSEGKVQPPCARLLVLAWRGLRVGQRVSCEHAKHKQEQQYISACTKTEECLAKT